MFYKKLSMCSFILASNLVLATPNVHSNYVLVKDIKSNSIIMSKNANVIRPIASLTKLMTAMVIIDAKQASQELLDITDEDVDHYKNSSSRLHIGTLLSREMLLHIALMSSENRAAHTLARHYPGGLNAFIAQMNHKAKELGLKHTRFTDPTGLEESNVSTAEELSILVEAASKYTLIAKYSTDKEQEVQHKKYINTNPLARGENSWPLVVSKTGYTQEAGRCVVMNTDINKKSIIVIILDAPTKERRTSDAIKIKNWVMNENPLSGKPKKG